jgi:hypothetical protein
MKSGVDGQLAKLRETGQNQSARNMKIITLGQLPATYT